MAELQFPGGALELSKLPQGDSDRTTCTPASLAAALRELEEAGNVASRALYRGAHASLDERIQAGERLTRAIVRAQFEATQHCGKGRAR